MDVKNSQRVLSFGFLGTIRLSKFSFFCLMIGFLKICPPNIFFQYSPNFRDGGSKILRNIRIFDVIFVLYCILQRTSCMIEKRSYLSQHALCELLKRFSNIKGALLVFGSFCEFFIIDLSLFSNLCAL